MSIRFHGRIAPKGLILVRELDNDDWGPNNQTAARYEDRGSLVDPVGETDDWGLLPSATV